MTTQVAPATTTRSAWGFFISDDGRVSLTHGGQVVATATYRTGAEQARVHALYAALVRKGGRDEYRPSTD